MRPALDLCHYDKFPSCLFRFSGFCYLICAFFLLASLRLLVLLVLPLVCLAFGSVPVRFSSLSSSAVKSYKGADSGDLAWLWLAVVDRGKFVGLVHGASA